MTAILIFIILIALIIVIASKAMAGNKAKNNKELRRRVLIMVSEKRKFIEGIKATKKLPTITAPTSLLLEKDESLILAEPTTLRETKSVRQNSGGFGSTRVGRFRVGGYSGMSSSSLEWTNLDQGTLFLTSQKLVFMGHKENRAIPLKRIMAVQVFSFNAVGISIEGRGKSVQFPVNNPYLWDAAIKIAKTLCTTGVRQVENNLEKVVAENQEK